jgi:hypothetical protein
MSQNLDPRLRKKKVIMGIDPGSPEGGRSAQIPAEIAAASSAAGNPAGNIELRLFSQLNQLKDIKSIQDKIAKKAEWLPEYAGYIEGCLAVSPAPQNHTLVRLMIWAADAAEYEQAVRIAEYAILNEMVMPEGHARSIAEFITEQCAQDFINDRDLAAAHAGLIEKLIEIGTGEDMVDEVRAKGWRALGEALKEAQPAEALNAYKNALRFNPKAGCVKQVTQLEKLLNRQPTGSSPDAAVGSQADSPDAPAADASVPASTDSNAPAE